MTSHPTEPFDPIAGAPEPDDQGSRTGPPSGALAGPPGGVFAGPAAGPPSRPFTGPPSGPLTAHHEPAHHEPAHHEPAHHEPAHQDAGYRAALLVSDPGQQYQQDGGDDDQIWAMMAYLGMIFFAFLPPLAVYLFRRYESRYVRFHAAQALNLWITAFLYTISFLIIGGILALDTIATGLSVGIPLIAGTGIAMLVFAVRAALAAGSGAQYQLPGWICVQLVR